MKIEVAMRAEHIYDLLLFHTYSRLSGFLVNVLGLAVIVAGGILLSTDRIGVENALLYVGAGFLFLSCTPLSLYLKSRKMIAAPCYKERTVYTFFDYGFSTQNVGAENSYSWSQVEKAVSTPKDIVFYVNEGEVLILPKESFHDYFMPVMKLIAENLTRDKIYIR
ncbi:YcxB family protein [Lacrimispora defluvii]|uniref:YcxB family protein n=1 Tax=Lacrimispora defluvii TaxID=2719233 RepID=A0ABX1VQC4_9FIRM|nr:YcxB family protein [Lacrimispora defluvii]NNJ28418.1 YcxB family protein [Lacrimispora defluvii]